MAAVLTQAARRRTDLQELVVEEENLRLLVEGVAGTHLRDRHSPLAPGEGIRLAVHKHPLQVEGILKEGILLVEGNLLGAGILLVAGIHPTAEVGIPDAEGDSHLAAVEGSLLGEGILAVPGADTHPADLEGGIPAAPEEGILVALEAGTLVVARNLVEGGIQAEGDIPGHPLVGDNLQAGER